MRPIRPEDAELERAFVNGLTEQSRRYRFMYAMSEITPQMLSRFTQIDYDREMALIATVGEGDAALQIGVARYVTNPDGSSCEFAVVVADDWHGRGMATRLMRSLIDVARARGLARMVGQALSDNAGMLALARHLGFAIEQDDDSPELVNLTLDL
jgi:acetyltransferase